ncbi:MAG: hypothetical protein JRG69_06280 [Deltaproteobacteria bacterium]|nr:hypothetical protein [Deltaproteobacteria bacterium]
MFNTITTINDEPFSYDDHCRMAVMVHIRFGRSITLSASAWRRMMQNDCSEADFEMMVIHGFNLAVEEGTRV